LEPNRKGQYFSIPASVCFHPELIDPKVSKSILQKQQAPGEGKSMVNFTETSVINYIFTGLQR
jgi:hypothetical protein